MLATDEGLMLSRRGRNLASLAKRNWRDVLIAAVYFVRREAMFHSPKHVLHRGRSVSVHGGLQLRLLAGDNGIARELRAFGIHEPILSEELAREVRPGETVVDIGANIGYYTLLLRQAVGSEGRVVAIEPSRANYDLLRENLDRNGFSDVPSTNLALANQDGEATLHISSKSNWCTLLPREDSEYVGSESIPTMTLSSIVESFGLDGVDVVRMDIEGFEFVAADGIFGALQRYRPRVYMEVHGDVAPSKADVDAFWNRLEESGYHVEWIVPRCLDVNIPSHVSEVAKYGWKYGDFDLTRAFSFEQLRDSGALYSEQFSVKLVPAESRAA